MSDHEALVKSASNADILNNLLGFRLDFAERWTRVETQLSAMQERMGTLETKTDRLSSDLTAFKADLSGAGQNIAELHRSDARLDEALRDLAGEVERLQERVWYLAAVATVGGAALGALAPVLLHRLLGG